MQVEELIGKTITNIYVRIEVVQEWLESARCFIELDKEFIIDIPFGLEGEVWEPEPDPKAVNIFNNLADYPFYHVNKEGKSIQEVVEAHKKINRGLINRLRALFGYKTNAIPAEYRPYKVEYIENKLKYILNSKITDILCYDDESEKAYVELDNGYIITETTMSPRGTGLAGLNYYQSLASFVQSKGDGFRRLTDAITGRCSD